jgi:glutamate synthase domain-containing protein 1
MNTKEFTIFGKYILNQLNYEKFKELFQKGVNQPLSESYIEQKWKMFNQNNLSFLICYSELTTEILKEIEKIKYKG